MKPPLLPLFLCFLSGTISATTLVDKWKLEYDNVKLISQSNGIEIWEMQTPDRSYYASSMKLPFRLAELQEILRENKRYPEWVPDVKKVEELEKSNDNSWLYYNVTDTPWPFKDRQSIVRMTQGRYHGNGWKLEFSLSDYPGFEMHNDREILSALSAFWVVTPDGEDACEVGYAIHTDNGGGIPDAIEVPFAQKTPAKNLIALQHYLEKNASTTKVIELAKVRTVIR